MKKLAVLISVVISITVLAISCKNSSAEDALKKVNENILINTLEKSNNINADVKTIYARFTTNSDTLFTIIEIKNVGIKDEGINGVKVINTEKIYESQITTNGTTKILSTADNYVKLLKDLN
ncbi:MAG: hypothetical protein WCK37_00110 [Candidatus Falkowbacteria bacterium]